MSTPPLPGQTAIPEMGVPDVPPRVIAPPASPTPPADPSAEAAARYLARGWQPVAIPARSKGPRARGWQARRYTSDEIPAAFGGDGNIGLILGAASGGLVDVDLDCPEAIALADDYLPPTDMRHGRPSTSLSSHRWYDVGTDAPPKVTRYADPADRSCLVELRSGSDASGAQTMVPPSIHPSGERVVWSAHGEPARVEIADLASAVRCLAGVALLARHWPPRGQRHDYALALAGLLLRDPTVTVEQAYATIERVARVGGSEDPAARAAVVHSTRARLAAGQRVTGAPRLAEIIGEHGDRVVRRVVEWLELRTTASATIEAPSHVERPGDGRPLSSSYLSVLTVVREDHMGVLGGRRVAYDEMRRAVTLDRRGLTDADVSAVRAEMEQRIVIAWSKDEVPRPVKWMRPTVDDVHRALEQVAHGAPYHPVRDYLRSLTWDGTPRIVMLPSLLGVEDTPIARAIMRRWAISAVARPLAPGAKVDTVLTLTGAQGALKSTAFRSLAGDEWFADTPISVGTKDAYVTLQGSWIHEWSELESLRRARDVEAVKAFISSAVDRYRPPYGRCDVVVPRTSIIVGTSNRCEILSDETGSRRWWPLAVTGTIQIDRLRELRDQLWAEAVRYYDAGEQWWLTRDEERDIAPLHEEHAVRDAWEDAVLGWCAEPVPRATMIMDIRGERPARVEITTATILEHGLGKPAGQWSRGDEMRVAAIMVRAGWTLRQRMVAGRRLRRWEHA